MGVGGLGSWGVIEPMKSQECCVRSCDLVILLGILTVSPKPSTTGIPRFGVGVEACMWYGLRVH